MTSLVMMYVYYDKSKNIKAITPHLDENFSNTLSTMTAPLRDVEKFLSGGHNTFDYTISEVKKLSGITYKIVKKQTLTVAQSVNSYLTVVQPNIASNRTIFILNNISDKVITVEMDREFKELCAPDTTVENELPIVTDFINSSAISLYITKKNNPYYLLDTIVFSPSQLLEADRLNFKYVDDYSDVSIYTKKIIEGFTYIEKV